MDRITGVFFQQLLKIRDFCWAKNSIPILRYRKF